MEQFKHRKKWTKFTSTCSWCKSTDLSRVYPYLYHRHVRNNRPTKCLYQNSPYLPIRKFVGHYHFQLYNPSTRSMLFLTSISDMQFQHPFVTKVKIIFQITFRLRSHKSGVLNTFLMYEILMIFFSCMERVYWSGKICLIHQGQLRYPPKTCIMFYAMCVLLHVRYPIWT